VIATHDLELVSHLARGFAAFHFGDRIDADRLVFDYRLRAGVASSRNAIALLQILGAPPAVVARAHERAAAMR
jgi:DNA mismatch repair ATPase MutS